MSSSSSPDVVLRSIGSFFVGGRTHSLTGLPSQQRRMVLGAAPRNVDPNGDHTAGQMYVQQYRLAEPRSALPVLLWHGGGMTGSHWESTPDGRPGWLWRFLQAGYDVLVSDAVERGRSSWAMYPHIYAEAPFFRTKNEGWAMFRIGPAEGYASNPADRTPFPDQQFPVDAFDDFAKQWVPRWPDHEEMTLAAYEALVESVGPCIVVAHSQGAGFAASIAQRRSDLVRAVVAIEPGGMAAATNQPLPPHLLLWGDHFGQGHRVWSAYRQLADDYWATASRAANRFHTIDLPGHGIHGNSHFPMLDRNSDAVAALVLNWLQHNAQ
jgi:pimeloyl-ACP methyl ester carboxylesterase